MADHGTAEAVPCAGLTPDGVLDALDGVGLRADGRMLAQNRDENRVYQVWLEDGGAVVVRFYRPGRWSEAAILAEHTYTRELAEREIPVVAPLLHSDATLHTHAGYRFAVYPRQGGRVPERSDPATLEWMGRFIARIHAVGALRAYAHRPTLYSAGFDEDACDFQPTGDWLPPDLRPIHAGVVDQALAGVRRAYDRAGCVVDLRLHGDCHLGNVPWTEAGPHFVDFDDSRMGPVV